MSGPKDICHRDDSIVIASMLSNVFISFIPGIRLQEGLTCSYIAGEEDIILGHRLGFLIYLSN